MKWALQFIDSPFFNIFPAFSISSSLSSGGDLHVPKPLPLLSNHLSKSLPFSSYVLFSAATIVVTNASNNTHCSVIVVDAFGPNHLTSSEKKKYFSLFITKFYSALVYFWSVCYSMVKFNLFEIQEKVG